MQKPIIRITKIFTIEMAHALQGYDGECRHIHGHSFCLHVTLLGRPANRPGHPKDGMVMDFKRVKEIVKEHIVDPLDHALVLPERTPPELRDALKSAHQKVILKPYQPTCENLLAEMAALLDHHLPPEVKLHRLKLYETGTSYAEWYREDNPE